MVQSQLQEAEEKAIFNEIYKNQANLEKDNVKQRQEDKKKEADTKKREDADKNKEETKQKDQDMEYVRKYQEFLLHFKRNCNIKELYLKDEYRQELKDDEDALVYA
jgi:hypothetical protein